MKPQPTLALAPDRVVHHNSLESAQAELEAFLLSERKHLKDFLTSVCLGGGKEYLSGHIKALPAFNQNGLSGYQYSLGHKMIAEVKMGLTISGQFVTCAKILGTNKISTQYFNHMGDHDRTDFLDPTDLHITDKEALQSNLIFEPACPILNFLYGVLSHEYTDTKNGTADTKRIYFLESFFNHLEKTRKHELSVQKGIQDPALRSLGAQIDSIEMDPVLTWKERLFIFKNIRSKRQLIIGTKQRVHHKWGLIYSMPIHFKDMFTSVRRFFKRPLNNAIGLTMRIFIDPPRWFFSVVRNNMGYSIAMAIYSPFTFFFITQPMNPHATWAAGKLRSAYIETTETVKSVLSFGDETKDQSTNVPSQMPNQMPSSLPAFVPSANAANNPIISNVNNNSSSHINGKMVVSTDREDVNQQSWDDRMSNFKAMQMSFESNLEIAPRFGRLEQMETQLNWPLIIESTWLETDRYLDQINALETGPNLLKPELATYLSAEKARTQQVQVYLWDRNIRFILDHPFTMMNQANDQTQFDYYIGRAFVLLRDMTHTLTNRYGTMALPKGYEKIEKLANHFEREYRNGNGIFDRLKKNSKVFAQKNTTDTQELRNYMKRQWEILYLLENRAQEASNSGLKMYVWSIRNAVYLLQTFYNSKREELKMMAPFLVQNSGNNSATDTVKMPTKATLDAFKRIDFQYEALFHMMVLEYASVRKEISEHLKQDIEATQRQTLIEQIESFLKQRETLLKSAKLL